MSILENVPAALCAVSVVILVVLGLVAIWADRNGKGEIFFNVTLFILIFIPIMVVAVSGEIVQTELDKFPRWRLILSIVFGLLAFLKDSGSALAGCILGVTIGLIYVLVGWLFGSVRTFEEALLFVGHLASIGWIGLPLMSWKNQPRTKTKS